MPAPVTVPEPEVLASTTVSPLAVVTVLPAASWTVAVRVQVAPETTLCEQASLSASLLGAPAVTVRTSVFEVKPSVESVAWIVSEPASTPVSVML